MTRPYITYPYLATGGTVARTSPDRWGDLLTLKDFGAVGNGVADDTAAITAWIMACHSSGVPGFAPPGTYLVSTVDVALTTDLELSFALGAVIKGQAGLTTSVVTLRGSGPARPRVRLHGINVDNSLREFVTASASGTGLTLQYLDSYLVEHGEFLSTADYRDDMGDSGISVNQCARGMIDHCYFRGQPDLGVYLTGGPDPGIADDFGGHTVQNCMFYRCAGTGSSKRQNRRVVWLANRVVECRTGFSNSEAVSGGVTIGPGREIIVNGNYFKRIGSRAITAGPGAIIFGNNVIEDWGYDPDGVLNAGGDAGFTYAVRWNASYGMCSNNILRFAEWSGATRMGIRVDRRTIDGVNYDPVGNQFYGNSISDCQFGISEANSATGNFGRNMFNTVTTPTTLAAGSTSKYIVMKPDGTESGP